jgi:hypothetical protein
MEVWHKRVGVKMASVAVARVFYPSLAGLMNFHWLSVSLNFSSSQDNRVASEDYASENGLGVAPQVCEGRTEWRMNRRVRLSRGDVSSLNNYLEENQFTKS